MNFYVVFTLLIGIVVLSGWKGKRMGLFLLILLFFLSAFRGEKVGNDTLNYMDASSIQYRGTVLVDFSDFEIDNLGNKVEILNNLVCKIIYESGLNTRWIIYFYSFVTFLFLVLSFKRFRVSLSYGLVFYVLLSFFFYSLTAARQLTAVSILLYAYSYLQCQDKRRFRFFFWVIVASLIHSFSIFFIIFFFVRLLPKPSEFFGLVIFIASLLAVAVEIDLVSQLSVAMDVEHLSDYVSTYGSGERNIFGKIESWAVVAFMYYFYYNATKQPDVNRNKVVDNLYLLSMLFYAALTNYPGLIGRIHYDLSIIQCVFLASYMGAGNRKVTSIEKVAYLFFVFICMYINNGFETSLRSSYYLMF